MLEETHAIFTPPDRIRRNQSKSNQDASNPKVSHPRKVRKRFGKKRASNGQPSEKLKSQTAAEDQTTAEQAPPGDAPPAPSNSTQANTPEQAVPTPSQVGSDADSTAPQKLTAAKSLAAPKVKSNHDAGAGTAHPHIKQEQPDRSAKSEALATKEPTSAVRERHVATAAAQNLRRPSTHQQLGTPVAERASSSNQQAPTPTPSDPPQPNGPEHNPPPTVLPQDNPPSQTPQHNPPSEPPQANPPPSQTSPPANPPANPPVVNPPEPNQAQLATTQQPHQSQQMTPSGTTQSRRRRQRTLQEKANHARFMRFTRHIKSPSVAYNMNPTSECLCKK